MKKRVEQSVEKIVLGCDTRALLYAYKNNIPCFYISAEAPKSIFRPKNILLRENFTEKSEISGDSQHGDFLCNDKLEYVLKFLLGCAGKLYQIERDNLRYVGGNLKYKSNKTEYLLKPKEIMVFDNLKLNGAKQRLVQSAYVLEDQFRLNSKSIDKTYFCLGDEFLNHVFIEGKNLTSSLRIKDKKLLNDFSYSSVAVRYHLEEMLKGRKELILERTYYANLKIKLKKRNITEDYKYHTDEQNVVNKTESLEKLCQNKILPSQESYLYYLTKKILDFHGTTP